MLHASCRQVGRQVVGCGEEAIRGSELKGRLEGRGSSEAIMSPTRAGWVLAKRRPEQAALLLLWCGLALAPGAHAETAGAALPAWPAALEPLRAKLEKYQDPVDAVHDGYFSTVGCVQYPDGGMGVHFLNVSLLGPVPDPQSPQILIYEPDDAGTLRLVAAEWLIPLATGVEGRPELFGQPFEGPMEGHVPLIPKDLHHYDLHVWLFKDNPSGLFHHANPDVDCRGKSYAIEEEPPPEVPHE
jgi:hypothetical protein